MFRVIKSCHNLLTSNHCEVISSDHFKSPVYTKLHGNWTVPPSCILFLFFLGDICCHILGSYDHGNAGGDGPGNESKGLQTLRVSLLGPVCLAGRNPQPGWQNILKANGWIVTKFVCRRSTSDIFLMLTKFNSACGSFRNVQ